MSIPHTQLADNNKDNATPSMIWSLVEISAGIACACLPAIPPVLQFFGRKLRVAASHPQRPIRRESRGLWYAGPIARGSSRENRFEEDGMQETLDEDFEALPSAYGNSMCASERLCMHYGTGSVDDSKSIPMTTIRSNKSSKW